MASATIKLAASRIGHNPLTPAANPVSPVFSKDGLQAHMDANLARTLATFRMAGEAGADFVLSTEGIHGIDYSVRLDKKDLYTELTEELDGPTLAQVSAISRQYGMYAAANYYVKDNGRIYNTTALTNRKGELVGSYRKIHLPPTERWLVTPGDVAVVNETDIGRIGHAICYDMVFPEHCRLLAIKGADIIINPTGGWGFNYAPNLGLALLQVRAAENSAYFVNAYGMNRMRPGSSSCILKNDGSVLAENRSLDTDGIALAEFIPDYDIMREKNMYTFFTNVPSSRARTLFERMPHTYAPLADPEPEVNKIYGQYKYAFEYEDYIKISHRYDEYKSDALEGREQTLPYVWE